MADNDAAQQLLQRHVRSHDACVTARPQEALALLEKGERFDAIVSDILLTSMSAGNFHAAVEQIAREQAERMIFIPALDVPPPGSPSDPSFETEAHKMARRKLLRTAAYVSPALLATFVSRPAEAQVGSCGPNRCHPNGGCGPTSCRPGRP